MGLVSKRRKSCKPIPGRGLLGPPPAVSRPFTEGVVTMFSCRSAVVWVVTLAAGACLACGCAKTRLDAEDVPASRRTADQIREQYQRINPGNRVGVVLAVRPQD